LADIIYYIFAFLIILSAMVIAFSDNLKRILLFSAAIAFSFAALLIVLKAQLIALVVIAAAGISVIPITYHFNKQAVSHGESIGRKFKLMLLPILALSAAVAITTSLSASTRFITVIENSYNYSLIFSAYLPMIFLVLLLASAVIRLITSSFRKGSQT